METAGLVGTSSAVDSQAWQEVMQHRIPTSTTRPPSILETGATCQSSAILHLHALHVFLHVPCKSSQIVSAFMLLPSLPLICCITSCIDKCRIGVASHCAPGSPYNCSFTLLAIMRSCQSGVQHQHSPGVCPLAYCQL